MEFGFDCRARKLSDKTISNYQKQLRYLERYLEAEYGITEVEDVRSLHLKELLVSMDENGRKPRYMMRYFHLPVEPVVKVGLLAQAPVGDGGIRVYEHLTIQNITVKNIRAGK